MHESSVQQAVGAETIEFKSGMCCTMVSTYQLDDYGVVSMMRSFSDARNCSFYSLAGDLCLACHCIP